MGRRETNSWTTKLAAPGPAPARKCGSRDSESAARANITTSNRRSAPARKTSCRWCQRIGHFAEVRGASYGQVNIMKPRPPLTPECHAFADVWEEAKRRYPAASENKNIPIHRVQLQPLGKEINVTALVNNRSNGQHMLRLLSERKEKKLQNRELVNRH